MTNITKSIMNIVCTTIQANIAANYLEPEVERFVKNKLAATAITSMIVCANNILISKACEKLQAKVAEKTTE